MPPETWTILKILNWATAYFKTHHIDQPRSDAEILLSHALGIGRVDLYVQYDRPLEPGELSTFRKLIKRRLGREPVAYIVGHKGFWTLDLAVTPDVLVPRPETELIVEAALGVIPSETLEGPLRVLDLGTGSGALVLALASERPGHLFFGVDSSREALGVAWKNAKKYGLEKAVAFFQGQWFDALPAEGLPFDVIVSNPPYIRRDELDGLPAEISRYEPMQALDGGPDGMDCIRLIIEKAPLYLKPQGWLFMEIGCDQGTAVQGMLEEAMAFEEIRVTKDHSGLDRVLWARAGSAQNHGQGRL